MLHEFAAMADNDPAPTKRSADAERMCALMSGWLPDEKLQLDAVHRFPILEMAPTAVDYFVTSGHFSARDLRFLVSELRLPIDYRDAAAVYQEILLRAQEAPWVLPVIETFVGGNRSGVRSGKDASKQYHVLSKFPLSKLRLKSHPDIQERLFQLHDVPVPVDLAVAAFCEYSVACYEHRVQLDGLSAVNQEAVAVLLEALGSVPQEHAALSPSDDEHDMAVSLLARGGSQDFQPTSEFMQQVVDTIQSLASNLDSEIEANAFRLISELANLGRKVVEQLPSQRNEALFAHLDTFGISYDPETVNDDGLAAFADLLDLGLAERLAELDREGAALEQKVLDLREKISVATKADDFATLASIAPEAKKAKSDLVDHTAVRGRVFELLAILISNGCEDIPEVSRELLGLLEQPAPAAIVPDVPQGPMDGDRSLLREGEELPSSLLPEQTSSILAAAAQLVESEGNTGAGEGLLETKSARAWQPEVDATSAIDDDEPAVTVLPQPYSVSSQFLADLLGRDLIGIAADVAETVEAGEKGWEISATALKAAAASRMARLDYGADTSRFDAIANRAMADELSDLSSVLVLGALVRPAILSANLRNSLQGLCRGVLGQHLQQVAEAISQLDYAFPPSPDVLAHIAGAQRLPQRQRFIELLKEWRGAFEQKTSRWPFATAFMHEIASGNGVVGRAIVAISDGDKNALSLAKSAIHEVGSPSAIDAQSIEFASRTGRGAARLHAKGLEYLYRQFDVPRNLLLGWVGAVEGEKSHDHLSEERIRSTVANLQTRIERAEQGLQQEEVGLDVLSQAVSGWIRRQLVDARKALGGGESGMFATLDEALFAERDLLPADAREALEIRDSHSQALVAKLSNESVLAPDQALSRACSEAAFDTAYRLAERFKIDAIEKIRESIKAFGGHWTEIIEQRQARLRSISKVDYKHQDDLARQLEWCRISLGRLEATISGGEVHDLADLPRQLASLDTDVEQIVANIRADQRTRISEYRNERNFEEATELGDALESLTIEAVEDRIAQLRDGRSSASFETDLEGVIGEFSSEFLAFASSSDWPKTYSEFAHQIQRPGHLFVEEDRRQAGLSFIKTYHDIVSSMALRAPIGAAVKQFFEELSFENVKLHDPRTVGRTAIWHCNLSGTIRSGNIDALFIPPAFGSQATAGYRLVLIGQNVLPEAVASVLTPEMPTMLVMAGVADSSRRRELAERLRSSALPVLLIDEALVAFAATRRHARLRTIFECGLPYGRIDPYTTDAGALPPEMFFGRTEEIRQIMSKSADGCLVYGGRQLGKSALLAHVERTEHSRERDQYVVRRDVKSLGNSEKTSQVWTHLSQMLDGIVQPTSRTADAVSADIHRWLSLKPRGRIVCMFDEADNFMDADTRADYPELSKLKQLMEDTGRAFKVVFAGLHNVQRMYRQPNSPLAHLGSPICIGPLNRTEDDKRAAHHLVVYPMRAAGFRFESHEAVDEVLAWANYYPSLVQEYMKGLLQTLHGSGSGKGYRLPPGAPLWPIETGTLFAHRGFQHIENRVREKFHLTLNLDPRYALVAFTLGRLNAEGREHEARVVGFEAEELLEEARHFWPKAFEVPSSAAFAGLLEELFDLGILGRVPIPESKRFRYLLGSRQVASMLGSPDDIYHALEDIERKDPAVAYDRSIYRRPYATSRSSNDPCYSPLTDLQIERIIKDASPIQIVCGLELLGLSKVGTSLAKMSEMGPLPGASIENMRARSVTEAKEIRRLMDAPRSGSAYPTLIVYSPPEATKAGEVIRWAEQQSAILTRQIRLLVTLDASDPEARSIATRREDQTQYLAAWGAEMVRVHLRDIEELGLDTPAMRTAILVAAGGVPSETTKLVDAMRKAERPSEIADNWEASVRIPGALLDGPLGKALSVIELSDDGDAEAFNAIMREQTGCDLVDIGPDLLATGLISNWNKATGSMRLSALGELVRRKAG